MSTVHKLGDNIQDCVVMSSVRAGISLVCGKCRKGCVIELPRAQFTSQDDLAGKHYYCPYCGEPGSVNHPGRITDIRPYGGDD